MVKLVLHLLEVFFRNELNLFVSFRILLCQHLLQPGIRLSGNLHMVLFYDLLLLLLTHRESHMIELNEVINSSLGILHLLNVFRAAFLELPQPQLVADISEY